MCEIGSAAYITVDQPVRPFVPEQPAKPVPVPEVPIPDPLTPVKPAALIWHPYPRTGQVFA